MSNDLMIALGLLSVVASCSRFLVSLTGFSVEAVVGVVPVPVVVVAELVGVGDAARVARRGDGGGDGDGESRGVLGDGDESRGVLGGGGAGFLVALRPFWLGAVPPVALRGCSPVGLLGFLAVGGGARCLRTSFCAFLRSSAVLAVALSDSRCCLWCLDHSCDTSLLRSFHASWAAVASTSWMANNTSCSVLAGLSPPSRRFLIHRTSGCGVMARVPMRSGKRASSMRSPSSVCLRMSWRARAARGSCHHVGSWPTKWVYLFWRCSRRMSSMRSRRLAR